MSSSAPDSPPPPVGTTASATGWDMTSMALAAASTVVAVSLSAYSMYWLSTREERLKHNLLQERKRELVRKQQEEEMRKKAEAGAHGPKLVVYFGSQTGTAETFAKTIGEGCRGVGLKALVKDLEDFDEDAFLDPSTRGDTLYCFVVATYGEGDPSDNAVKFHAWLTENQDVVQLPGLRYTVFGLGNKQYEHFNAMGKFVNSTLEKMGATAVYKYGEGDDDGRIQDDFSSWVEDLHEDLRAVQFPNSTRTLDDTLGGGDGLGVAPEFMYESMPVATPTHPPAMVQSGGRINAGAADLAKTAKIDLSSKAYFRTVEYPVVSIKELRASPGPDGLGSTLHVELAVPPGTAYGTAHNLSIVPENDPTTVSETARLLGVDLDAWLVVRPKKGVDPTPGPLFPVPCTLRTILSSYCALTSVPGRALLGKMAHFVTEPAHQARLVHLASKAGKEEYSTWVQDRRMSVFEVLREFPSWRFPDVVNFVEMVPRLMARDYTIASSCKAHPKTIALVVSRVTEPLSGGGGRFHKGVCTHALDRRFKGDAAPVYAFVKPSSFALPDNPLTPLVMVGPGTGVAPMRALIQEREWQKAQGMRVGPAVLFFGCRRRDEDFIYEAELKQWEKAGVLSGLFVAFSRDGPNKVYVTHHLQEQGHLVWDLLGNKDGHMYLCGGTQMGRDVAQVLESVFEKHLGDPGKGKGKGFLQRLVEEGRFTQELWS